METERYSPIEETTQQLNKDPYKLNNPSTTVANTQPHDPNSQSNVREINQQSENNERVRAHEVTPEELLLLEQNRTAAEDEEIRRVTSPVDDKCCGVNIFEKKLQNINKCIEQHIKNTGNRVNPIYNEWKEIDEEENTCQSPQHILAKTSNCYDIVNEYKDNINSLLCISNQNTEGSTILNKRSQWCTDDNDNGIFIEIFHRKGGTLLEMNIQRGLL